MPLATNTVRWCATRCAQNDSISVYECLLGQHACLPTGKGILLMYDNPPLQVEGQSLAADDDGVDDSGGGAASPAPPAEDDVHLHLSCQKFVEMVRVDRVFDAVEFARQVGLHTLGLAIPKLE